MAVQLEDVLGASEQVNIPGTVTEYPNWRRKLPLELEKFSADARVLAMLTALKQTRP
jgi:(1->4)-alpha-D-glucan 1-alpha-D-glucosylmutase